MLETPLVGYRMLSFKASGSRYLAVTPVFFKRKTVARGVALTIRAFAAGLATRTAVNFVISQPAFAADPTTMTGTFAAPLNKAVLTLPALAEVLTLLS
jgi:hypothetical protein